MLKLYRALSKVSQPVLKAWLKRRLKRNKEDEQRLPERMGQASIARPDGRLIWLHAASVGEAQSILILVKYLKAKFNDAHFLITTGTVTSSQLMMKRLPEWAIHQYYPLDIPVWVNAFLDHWHPDLAIWTESELWPNMLTSVGERNIPTALVNARISSNSYKKWSLFPATIQKLFGIFDMILAQTEDDARMIRNLGARKVIVTDSLKYCAESLFVDANEFNRFSSALASRIGWLFASTHHGEEDMAFNIHMSMKEKYPNLLTVIAPRHPDRRDDIIKAAEQKSLNIHVRSESPEPPAPDTDIYLVNTLGELGLFYKLCGIACIGRSFSLDGGGGHNPIEAIQLGCVTLHGPNVQNFTRVYRDMDVNGVSIPCKDKNELQSSLETLMEQPEKIFALQDAGAAFISEKSGIIDLIMDELEPLFIQAGLNCPPLLPNSAVRSAECV